MCYPQEGMVTYQIAFHRKPGYLHAVVTGQNTPQNISRYLNELIDACREKQFHRALIEERLTGPRLKALDVFKLVSEASERAVGVLRDVAYVDVNEEGDLMHFAETVARNRWVHVRRFSTVEEAEAWLNQRDGS